MANADALELYMLDLINEERTSRGLDPLQLEQNLNASAEDHSEWMLETDIFSHTGVGNSTATERMEAAGFDLSGSWQTAENIAVQSERGDAGFEDDVADLHTSLMNSSGHRANLLDPDLDYIGIGIEVGNFDFDSGTYNSVIVTQNFGSTEGNVTLDTGADTTEPFVVGSAGDDTLTGTASDDDMRGVGGNDVLRGGSGEDFLRGGTGDDVIKGNANADTLVGNNGSDKLWGGGGKDLLFGSNGSDFVYGGAAADRLDGGAGDDRLFGGAGADRFVFKEGYDTDRVMDFENNVDRIDLRSFNFGSADNALDLARQAGDNVIFNFDGGDDLIIRETTIAALENDLMI